MVTLLLLASLSPALSVYAQLPTRVAYLYASDTTARDNFKAFLELQNFTVEPVRLDEVARIDFTQFQIIIIAHDTGSSSTPFTWLGSSGLVQNLVNTQRYIVTIGNGAQFFDAHGFTTSQSSCGLRGSTVRCAVGNLAAGANTTFIIEAKASEAGAFTTSAIIKAAVSDPDPSNNQTSRTANVTQPANFSTVTAFAYRPIAVISSLDRSLLLMPGELLVLQGIGYDMEDGMLTDLSLEWSSDRDGLLGSRTELPITSLSQGLHQISLRVTPACTPVMVPLVTRTLNASAGGAMLQFQLLSFD